MPHLINGIGTWYLGKSNRRIDRGVCEHCGSFENLQSYDTTRYFLLVFLPLIPLGKWRVLRECGRCRRHGTVKLREWQRQRREQVAEAIAAYEADPADPAKAGRAVGTTMVYDRRDAFARLATLVLQHLGEDPDTLLTLADALHYFGRQEEAESALRRAHRLRDDPDTREALAVHLMRQGKPEEAQQLLQHLLDDANPDSRGVLFFLVEAFQVKGDHRSALQVLDAIELVFPTAAEEKEFKKYRRVSQKRQASGKPVRPVFLAPAPGAVRSSERGWLGWLAMAVWPLILVGLLAAVVVPMVLAYRSASVYLVNGTSHQYAVEVAGEGRILPPGRRPIELDIPRNETVVFKVAEPGLAVEPLEVHIRTPFWKGLFDRKTRIVNPDRTALVLWEQIGYSENPDVLETMEFPASVQSGRGYYEFARVDFKFIDFPEEIEISSSSKIVTRERVDLIPVAGPLQALFILQQQEDGKDLVPHLEARLRFNPDELEAAQILAGLDEERFKALAEPQLKGRPLKVDWHRLYQDTEKRGGREVALLERYRGALVQEPNNGDLLYLAGRIDPDPIQAEVLYRRSMAADPPSAYGFNALAYQKLAGADFPAALELVDRALALIPDHPSFRSVEEDTLLALGQYEKLLQRTQEALAANPQDASAVYKAVLYYTASGNLPAARQVIETSRQNIATAAGDEAGDSEDGWSAYLEALIHYVQGDAQGFLRLAKSSQSPNLEMAFLANDLDTVETIFADEGASAELHLLAHLKARRLGDEARAEAQLQAALQLLREGDTDQRRLAEYLTLPPGSPLPPPEIIRWWPLDAGTKAIMLTALAEHHPGRAAEFRSLARRLNFRLDFPRLTLAGLLGG